MRKILLLEIMRMHMNRSLDIFFFILDSWTPPMLWLDCIFTCFKLIKSWIWSGKSLLIVQLSFSQYSKIRFLEKYGFKNILDIYSNDIWKERSFSVILLMVLALYATGSFNVNYRVVSVESDCKQISLIL